MNFLTESNLPFRASQRLGAINVSEILKISSLTNEMKRQGRDVIDLSVGEPDFSTPDHIKEAAARAMRNEATKYTALDGTIELKVAIQEKFRRENNISYGLNEVTVSAGAKQILFNALMASLNIGDEVIIPDPGYPIYASVATLAGAHADQPNGAGRRGRKTLGEAALHDGQPLRQRTGRVVVLAVPGLVVSNQRAPVWKGERVPVRGRCREWWWPARPCRPPARRPPSAS